MMFLLRFDQDTDLLLLASIGLVTEFSRDRLILIIKLLDQHFCCSHNFRTCEPAHVIERAADNECAIFTGNVVSPAFHK